MVQQLADLNLESRPAVAAGSADQSDAKTAGLKKQDHRRSRADEASAPSTARRKSRRTSWYLHMALIHLSEFGAEASRGLVLPTLFTYAQQLGGDLIYVGLLTSMFSIGRFFSSLLFGWLCDRISFRAIYNVAGVCAIVGNLMYVLPYSPSIHSRALLAASRFVVGFGAGNRSVCRANIAMLTRVEQRLQYFTLFATVVFLAYALTPGFGGIVGDTELEIDGEYVYFNRLTAPGFVLAVLNAGIIVFNNIIFDASISREDAPNDTTAEADAASSDDSLVAPASDANAPTPPLLSDRMATLGMLVFIFLNFNARGILSIFETVNVPLFLQMTGRDSIESEQAEDATHDTSTFYLVIGLLGLVTYAAVHQLRKRHSDVSFVIFGFSMLLVGNAILLLLCILFNDTEVDESVSFNVFVGAEVFVWSIGCPITSAVIVSAFSKVLGTRRQGFLMGVFGSSASVARTILPLLPGILSAWAALFVVNIVLCLICIVVLVAYLAAIEKTKKAATTYTTVAADPQSTSSAVDNV